MDIWRQGGSVLVVFALLGAVLWTLRRKGGASFATTLITWRKDPGRTRSLVVLERLALTPQHSLHLVRMDGREVVVATHPTGCSLLIEAEAKKEVDS